MSPDPSGSPDYRAELALLVLDGDGVAKHAGRETALVEGVGGRYFEDCHEAEVVPAIVNGVYGVRDYALDPEAADRLWDESLRFLG